MKKGFVYTLESVVASTIILSMVVIVLPEVGPQPDPELSIVDSGLQTLEKTGELDRELSPLLVEDKIEPYTPNGFNTSAVIYTSKSNYSLVNAPESVYLNTDGNYSDLQLWIESANDLNVSFNDTMIWQNLEGQGYRETTLPSAEGWLNFSGNGKADYSINSYSIYGKTPDEKEVRSKNMLTFYKKNREVQIKLW